MSVDDGVSLAGLTVLLVAPDSTGGIGRHVQMLAEGLLARGAKVTVCAPATTLARFDLAATGADIVMAPVGSWRGWRKAQVMLRSLAAQHSITHAHGVRAAAAAASAGSHPLVATWHNAPLGSAPRRAVHRMLERYVARRSALVLGASSDLVERARTAGAARARLCEVAAPPTGAASLAVAARGLHDPPRVLAIGRLHRQKRFDLLLDVAAGWPAGAGRPEFLVVGDGPLADELAQLAAARHAPVRFLGARSDVADLLADADVVVLSSDWEARPLVAQEALAAGVPVVATDVGGVRELVADAAVLVPRGDAQALAAAIRRVLEDGGLRARLRRLGPERAGGWPTVSEMVDRIAQDYLDLNLSVSLAGVGPAPDTPGDSGDSRAEH